VNILPPNKGQNFAPGNAHQRRVPHVKKCAFIGKLGVIFKNLKSMDSVHNIPQAMA
jgi:hypothetical protein